MEIPARKIIRLLVEHDPASAEFRNGLRNTLRMPSAQPRGLELNVWNDVFVEQELPWVRFVQSAILHASVFGIIWVLSLTWLRQQKILASIPFDRSSVITYSPQEYLPPLDTGTTEAPKPRQGDPVFAKQPILSVPREADNRSQTIVVPPELKLNHDVPLPNIVATGAIAPVVPLNATNSLSRRTNSPDPQVIAPTPEVNFARDSITPAALKSEIVPPPPEVKRDRTRGLSGPESAVVQPPPDVTMPAKGHVGSINIGPSAAVAPAPQLTLTEQHALYARGQGGGKNSAPGNAQPVAPPPSVSGTGGSGASGRLIALGIHPVTPTGPVAVPGGNRRGTFEASPKGKLGASGTPDFAGTRSSGIGSNGGADRGSGLKGRNGATSLPSGLRVGAVPGATGSVARDGTLDGSGDAHEMASATVKPAIAQRAAAAISDDKITDVDRQVFGERRPYAMTLNMPNLNSSTGSWVIRFAELQPDQTRADLLAPFPIEKSDPGYPLELIRNNVRGKVVLYAVIHPNGRISDVRVLSSPDDRLDAYATSALARWKFLPAMKNGKPVAIDAVVEIPFRVSRTF